GGHRAETGPRPHQLGGGRRAGGEASSNAISLQPPVPGRPGGRSPRPRGPRCLIGWRGLRTGCPQGLWKTLGAAAGAGDPRVDDGGDGRQGRSRERRGMENPEITSRRLTATVLGLLSGAAGFGTLMLAGWLLYRRLWGDSP